MDVEARAEALAIAAYEAAEPGGKPWARLEPGEWERWRRVANLVLAPSEAPAQRLTDERAVIHIGFISHDTLTRLQDSDWQKQRGDVADPAVIFTMNNPPSRCVIPVYIESAVRAQAGDAQDAARYRWLRRQHWSDAPLCVVAHPKNSAKLGHDCPSLDRLDAAIDAQIKEQTP